MKKRILLLMTLSAIISIITGCTDKELNEADRNEIYTYISESKYDGISFMKVIQMAKIKEEKMEIQKLDMRIDNEGYFESINVSFYLEKEDVYYTLYFRKDIEQFKLLEAPTYTTRRFEKNENIPNPLELLDQNIAEFIVDIGGYCDKARIGMTPNNLEMMKHGYDLEQAYRIARAGIYAGEQGEQGLIFRVYGTPYDENKEPEFYFFH